MKILQLENNQKGLQNDKNTEYELIDTLSIVISEVETFVSLYFSKTLLIK